jgi:hypothetical protein
MARRAEDILRDVLELPESDRVELVVEVLAQLEGSADRKL